MQRIGASRQHSRLDMAGPGARGGGGMARLSKAHQALLDKLSQMDLEPPHYEEIIAKNDQIMMMEEEIKALNNFVRTTFEEYRSSNQDTTDALDDEIRRVEERLRDEKAQLE